MSKKDTTVEGPLRQLRGDERFIVRCTRKPGPGCGTMELEARFKDGTHVVVVKVLKQHSRANYVAEELLKRFADVIAEAGR